MTNLHRERRNIVLLEQGLQRATPGVSRPQRALREQHGAAQMAARATVRLRKTAPAVTARQVEVSLGTEGQFSAALSVGDLRRIA